MTKPETRKFVKGLLMAVFLGAVFGTILWLAGVGEGALLWGPLSFGMVYLRIRWMRNINKSKSDIKLKQMV